jgi:hypothetical protein
MGKKSADSWWRFRSCRNRKNWISRVGLFLVVAFAFWFVWNESVTRMFGAGNMVLSRVAFWLGRWTVTGWIFYVVVSYLIYRHRVALGSAASRSGP